MCDVIDSLISSVAGAGSREMTAVRHGRAARAIPRKPHDALTPALLDVHDEACDADDADTQRLVVRVLPALPGDALLAALTPRFAEGDFRLADVVTRKVQPSPELEAEATLRLLDDPIDDVRRTAIRTVGFGRFTPAVPALVELLADRSPVVRRAAEDAEPDA
jgi:hypothetical protein